MTLGGLALAVGILVDDATVTIENINYHLEQGKDVETAILDGAHQIALPALVSTLSICIVFVPMFLLAGIAKFLFMPLAEAVVFAMLASYLLSRTLVPTLAKFWLKAHDSRATSSRQPGLARRFQAAVRARLRARCASAIAALLQAALAQRPALRRHLPGCDGGDRAAGLSVGTAAGSRPGFLPDRSTAARSSCICARAPARASRRPRRLCDASRGDDPRSVIPRDEISSIVDNIGLPYSGINLAYSTSAPVGPGDADIYVNLCKRASPADRGLRAHAAQQAGGRAFPSRDFAFLPADMISQILNFGLPSPDRCADRRIQRPGQPRLRRHAAAETARHPGRGRSAHSASRRLPAIQCRCRPHQGAAGGSDPAERREQHAGVAVRQLSDLAVLLDRSEERHAIPVVTQTPQYRCRISMILAIRR